EDNGLERSLLTAVMTHKGYLEAIERIKKDKEEKPLEFHQVPKHKINIFVPKSEYDPEPEEPTSSTQMVEVKSYTEIPSTRSDPPEVVEPRNDIELNITKGVKVIVSPNIDSIKIIKIIDLLKDL